MYVDFYKWRAIPKTRLNVLLLAVLRTREEPCKQVIELVCDAFQRPEEGSHLATDVENVANTQVKAVMAGGLWGENPWQTADASCSSYKAS
ncbi:protein white [Gryllus bimaculatus]|nr:protein white [Gryllus bimaculatus]